jgi:hypothetical protein
MVNPTSMVNQYGPNSKRQIDCYCAIYGFTSPNQNNSGAFGMNADPFIVAPRTIHILPVDEPCIYSALCYGYGYIDN